MCIAKYLYLMDDITNRKGLVILVTSRHNISLDDDVYEEFCRLASKKGIKISTWINLQMKNFIEEEKMLEEIRKKRS